MLHTLLFRCCFVQLRMVMCMRLSSKTTSMVWS